MESVLRAPFDARVRELLASVGSQVSAGTPLARLEAVATDGGAVTVESPAPPADLMIPPAAEGSAAERALAGLGHLRGLVLGFDVAGEGADLIVGYLAGRDAAGTSVRQGELDLVTAFADIAELWSAQPETLAKFSPNASACASDSWFSANDPLSTMARWNNPLEPGEVR